MQTQPTEAPSPAEDEIAVSAPERPLPDAPDAPPASLRYQGPRRYPRLVALLALGTLIALAAAAWVLLGQPRLQAQQATAWQLVHDDQLTDAAPLIQRYRLHRPFYNAIRSAFDARADAHLTAAAGAIAATNELAALDALRPARYFGDQEATRVDLLHTAATAHDEHLLATFDELISQRAIDEASALLATPMQSDAGRTALRHAGLRLLDLGAIQTAAGDGDTPTVLALIERNPIPLFQQFRRVAFDANRDHYHDITNLTELAPLSGQRVSVAGTLTASPTEQDGAISVASFEIDRRHAPPLLLRFALGSTTLAALQQDGVTRGARVTVYGVLDLQQQRRHRLLWFDRTRTTLALSPVTYWIPSPAETP